MAFDNYSGSFKILFTRSLTKDDYISLCNILGYRFNDHYGITNESSKYKFLPKMISDGSSVARGISMVNFPNKRRNMHKHIVHFISWGDDNTDTYDGGLITKKCTWLFSPNDVEETWKNDESILIFNDTSAETLLKSSEYASPWTIEEFVIIKECFHKYGIEIIFIHYFPQT